MGVENGVYSTVLQSCVSLKDSRSGIKMVWIVECGVSVCNDKGGDVCRVVCGVGRADM